VTSTDPAVEIMRGAFAADAGLLALAEAARFLLCDTSMPVSERRAMCEELAAADPGDLPTLLTAWHLTAALHAQAALVLTGRQQPDPAHPDGAEAHSGP
jgi:hypothetical protein